MPTDFGYFGPGKGVTWRGYTRAAGRLVGRLGGAALVGRRCIPRAMRDALYARSSFQDDPRGPRLPGPTVILRPPRSASAPRPKVDAAAGTRPADVPSGGFRDHRNREPSSPGHALRVDFVPGVDARLRRRTESRLGPTPTATVQTRQGLGGTDGWGVPAKLTPRSRRRPRTAYSPRSGPGSCGESTRRGPGAGGAGGHRTGRCRVPRRWAIAARAGWKGAVVARGRLAAVLGPDAMYPLPGPAKVAVIATTAGNAGNRCGPAP